MFNLVLCFSCRCKSEGELISSEWLLSDRKLSPRGETNVFGTAKTQYKAEIWSVVRQRLS